MPYKNKADKREFNRLWAAANKEKMKESRDKWYAANKDRLNAAHRAKNAAKPKRSRAKLSPEERKARKQEYHRRYMLDPVNREKARERDRKRDRNVERKVRTTTPEFRARKAEVQAARIAENPELYRDKWRKYYHRAATIDPGRVRENRHRAKDRAKTVKLMIEMNQHGVL